MTIFRARPRAFAWIAGPLLLLAGCVSAPLSSPSATERPARAGRRGVGAGARRAQAVDEAAAQSVAVAASAPEAAGRRAGAGRSAAPRSAPRSRRARRARRPVGTGPPRLRDARPRQRPGARPRALVRDPARLRGAHDRARRPLPVPHRRGARQARHADRAGAAALHRERLQPAGDVGGAGLGHVAVHPVDRARLRAQAERLPRRPARRPRLHPGGARLPAEALRDVRRLAAGAGRLQLGRRQRAAGDREEPARRPADRLREPAHAGRDAALRAEAAGGEEHRRPPRRLQPAPARAARTIPTS